MARFITSGEELYSHLIIVFKKLIDVIRRNVSGCRWLIEVFYTMPVISEIFVHVSLLQFTTPGGTTLLQPNIFITVLAVASTVGYQAKHVSCLLLLSVH